MIAFQGRVTSMEHREAVAPSRNKQMPPLTDFSSCFDDRDEADVILHLITAAEQTSGQDEKDQQEHVQEAGQEQEPKADHQEEQQQEQGAADQQAAVDEHGAAKDQGAAEEQGTAAGQAAAMERGVAEEQGAAEGHGPAEGQGTADKQGAVEVHGTADGPGAAEQHGATKEQGAADEQGATDEQGSVQEHGAAEEQAAGVGHGAGEKQGASEEQGAGVGQGAAEKEAQEQGQEQPCRTYYLHAFLLRRHSAYFKARLHSTWRQQELQQNKQRQPISRSIGSGSTMAAPEARYELVEHVDAAELDAMEQLLRLIYSQQAPTAASPLQLLQVLRLADRYQAVVCSDLVLSHMAAIGKQAVDASTLTEVPTLPPGLHSHPAYSTLLKSCEEVAVATLTAAPSSDGEDAVLLDACKGFLVWRFQDVPSVISNSARCQQFCSLPFKIMMFWATSDQLQVHSENCVVYLLSAWVAAQKKPGGQGVTSEQLEQLAEQVRVLHLGPGYQLFVLPNLDWFKSCSGMPYLPILMALKGMSSMGVPVYPAPTLPGSSSDDWEWTGPDAWVAGPRQRTAPQSTLSWELTAAEVHQVYDGEPVRSPCMYINGFQVQMSIQKWEKKESEKLVTFGMFFYTSQQAMLQHGVTWPEVASTPVCKVDFTVKALGICRTLQWFRSGVKGAGWGFGDVLQRSAPSIQELLAPLLVDGELPVEMTVSGVDMLV